MQANIQQEADEAVRQFWSMASIPYSSTCVHLLAVDWLFNQCFISPQFPKGRAGPWSTAVVQSLPTSKQCLLTMKACPRQGRGKKQNNLLTIHPVYCTCLAIWYSQSLDCTTDLVFGRYLSVSFECHHFTVHCNPKYGQTAKSLIFTPLSQERAWSERVI